MKGNDRPNSKTKSDAHSSVQAETEDNSPCAEGGEDSGDELNQYPSLSSGEREATQ